SVTLNAGNSAGAATQIGFFTNGSGAATGAINVGVHSGGLTMNSGNAAGAYTMIGHGGSGATDEAINADVTISFCDPSILDLNANGDGAFSQIGHGVQGGSSAIDGNISAEGFSNLTMNGGSGAGAYVQIGHGGNLSSAGVDEATITLTGASLNGQGGAGDGSFVMVGHGGLNETRNATNDGVRAGFAEATRSGDVDVTLTGNFDMTGGSGQSSFVQVGHGGRRNNAVNGEGHSGAITISSRSFDIFGGAGADSFGMAGHGGFQTTGNHSGDISITTTGPNNDQGRLRLRPDVGGNDDADRAFTQIGHGGYDADFDTASDFSADRYVDNRASTLSGNITLDVAENVVVVAVASNAAGEAYSQVGHGGFDTTGSFGGAGESIQIDAGNAIIVQGGQIAPTADTVGRGNYAQIGHGGAVNIATGAAPHEAVADPSLNAAANGSHTGDITINSASINIDAGIDNENYAQIGHGGINSGNGGAHTGDISMTTSTGSIRLQGGPGGGANAHAMIGHGGRNVNGNHNGSIILNSGQNILLEASGAGDAFSQIGHGGRDSDGNLGTATDVISATAAGFVRLRGGPTNSYAHIGLGGYLSDGDKVLDSISVVANGVDTSATGNGAGVLVSGGNGDRAYAHIGNGGAFAYGSNFAGDVTVTATAGGVSVIAPDNRNQTYAMIGHGGRFDRANNGSTYNIGTMTSDITVSALGADSDILVDGGGGTSFAQIGLGGFQAGYSTFGPASFNGAIDIEAGRDVILQGGVVVAPANSNGFAQIGHGGRDSQAEKSGEVAIDLGRNLSLTGGGTQLDIARTEQYAQIGHGGRAASGEINGDILINQDGGAGAGSVTITGGDSDRSYAQVGHGGHGYTGDIGQTAGALTLTTVGNIDVHGGSDQEAYAQIGHGGDSADASGAGFNGAVSVTSTSGNISLLSNPGDVTFANRASARIGHGGLNNNDATGDFTGNISVNAAAGSVTLDAAAEGSNNSVQIGHGGIGASALSTHNGTIDVTAGTTISVLGGVAGGGDIRFAQIGHGGDNTNGIFSGAITVDAGSDVTLTGGNENRSSALVGHGGFNSDGAKDGAISVTSGGAVALTPGAINQSFAQIGHGGESSEGSIGATNIANITVDAATGVNLAGNQGPTGTAYTQIGHGGLRGGAAGNTIAGAIDVSTDAGDVLLSGSRNGTGESYNQIGHGGLASIYDIANQNIGVEATAGAITLSGSASQNHVMIGHGGERSTGDFSGDIDVHSQNNISLTGGRNTDALTQIGHGGSDHVNGAASTLGGEIHVHSTNGSVSVTTLGSINNGSAVQIGHGGYQAALATTTITGDICVVAGTTAEVSAAGGGGDSSYAMIGHGGVRLAGDRTGNIVVTTGTAGVGGVTLTGGDSTNEFAQIGHGGIDSNGNMSGDVYVIADGGGDVTLQGGTNSSTNYAMIGHGDSEGNTSQGRREGGIHIFGTNLSAANGAGLENVNIYHQTQGGLAGNYDGGDGFQIIPDAANVAASAKDDIAVMVTGNFGSGDINYIDSSDVDIVFDGAGTGDILVNSSDDFFFVTGGDVTFLNSYQNAGSGNVTIVAGWNGAGVRPPATVEYADLGGGMFNYCEPTIRESGVQIDFNDCSTFGNEVAGGDTERGTITLGAADQDNAVYVGSRLGRTVAAGYGITLNAGDTDGAATQLGFHNGSVAGNAGNMTGAIDVFAKGGGLTLNAGSALNTYAQIGHGGTGATVNAINAAVTVSFCEPGDVIFNDPGVATAGSGSHAYTQIGHGINDGAPTVNGAVLVDGFRNLAMNAGGGNTAYALLGHGGDNADGNKDGTVTLTGAAAIADRGNITLNGGGGNEAFAQIGHGGRAVNNNKFGAIDISNVVNIDLNGGAGLETQAHIGHGGGDGSNGPVRGTIDLNLAGNLTLDAGTENEAFAMVGHGGHSSVNMVMLDGAGEADININAGGYISITGTAAGTPSTAPDENIAPQAFAQIGHGGRGSRGGDGGATAREFHGDISITANGTDANGNAVTLQAGNSNESYAQIGHGGRAAFSYGDGNIDIDAAGNVDLEGGGRSRTYAMIGHGGDEAEKINNFIGNSDGTNTFGTLMGNRGTIDITTTNGGGLFVTGSQAPTGIGADHNDSGAQVGHGGHGTFGNHTGDIILGIDGDVTLTGGANSDNNGDDRNFAIIGHGGENGDGKLGGTISVTSGGSITGTAGNGGVNFVQIGHGGRNTDGEDDGTGTRVLTDAAATITVVAENNIQFDRGIGNDFDTYAMIGHGGTTSRGTKAGAISVTSNTGDILFGTDTTRTGRGSVSIGHGGRGANGDTSGNITVESTAGDIRFHGVLSTGDANHREGYAQLGHGGRDATGNHGLAGDVIDVDSGEVIEFLAGSSVTANQGTQGREAYAQLGNGGYQSDGDHAGTINVDAASDITFDTRGASGDRSYVQLGHGGFSSNGSFSGDINVNQNVAGGAITFLAGRSASFAQLGHGGRNDAGSTRDNSGADGIANTADDVRVESSARFMPGTITGDIAVGASDDITFTGGFQAGGTGFAQIGHGGYHQMAVADEGHSGSIEVITSGGAINFTAGQRNAQHAMIGHGGHQSLGNHFGDITVEAATGIAFTAGGETTGGNNIASFAQIGHGGFDSDFDAGRSIGDFGVVNGAGGFNDDIPLTDPGTMTGAISISTTGAGADIVLTGSQGDNSTGRVGYAQFGHGGVSNSGDREGTITVESGGAVLLNRGTTDDGYAQIGHGGRNAHGTISNADITVTSANGGKVALQGTGLPATAGTSSRAYAQIGHGGHNADVQADSAVTVTGSGGVDIL
ncbi:MAG: hypothetical protein MI807_04445, partial [Verrucomicrobiales bacterium]|nr:hypothetical protein [Verrucomicrobiales bacterium]